MPTRNSKETKMPEKVSNKEALDRLHDTRKALDTAFAFAVSTEEMREIYRAIRVIDNEIIVLVKKAMDDENAKYAPATDEMKNIVAHLKTIRSDIDRIVFAAETAAQIINALTKLINILA